MTGLKENALAAVAEIQLMAYHKLLPQDVLVPLRIERDRELLVLGPDGYRAAKIQRDFGVRIVRPVNVNGPLMLEGSVEAVTEAEAFGEHLLAGLRQAMTEIPRS